ncbi:MAG TPA: dihydrolipoamide acetyltransferase family protein [Cyclobacteriaceae bacterium]|nr:dihydrolipoamide acetyltransferase family protein [Cyclobacteriaceae bacterium]
MATPVIMPRQGQSVESCLFSSWHVEKGSMVKKGDLLFTYETDKATFDAEAPEDGILLETFAATGDLVPVLQNIGVIGQEGESYAGLIPGAATQAGGSEQSNPESSREINIAEQPGNHELPEGRISISPRARKAAKKLRVNPTVVSGSGPGGRIVEKDILRAASSLPKATPLAKSMAFSDKVALPKAGSGSGGKITVADLKGKSGKQVLKDYEEMPLSNIRKIIARNMQASLQNTAQLTLHSSADASAILELRKKYKKIQEGSMSPGITINDLVCYAVVKSLKIHPYMNSHFLGESVRFFNAVHLGFAVDTPRGLMVPTVFHADTLSLQEFSDRIKDLASRANKGNIDPELLSGATFSVTNLGALGVEMFTPVLNPPQVGILGINAIRFRPEDSGNGVMEFIPAIGLSLTFDHRAVDGAPAAIFLKEVAQRITNFE